MIARINATPTVRDGIRFPSTLEGECYDMLVILQKAGEVITFIRQPKFDLGGNTTYTADYLVFWHRSGDNVTVIEVKGRRDAEGLRRYKRNKKQMEARYPFTVELWP